MPRERLQRGPPPSATALSRDTPSAGRRLRRAEAAPAASRTPRWRHRARGERARAERRVWSRGRRRGGAARSPIAPRVKLHERRRRDPEDHATEGVAVNAAPAADAVCADEARPHARFRSSEARRSSWTKRRSGWSAEVERRGEKHGGAQRRGRRRRRRRARVANFDRPRNLPQELRRAQMMPQLRCARPPRAWRQRGSAFLAYALPMKLDHTGDCAVGNEVKQIEEAAPSTALIVVASSWRRSTS